MAEAVFKHIIEAKKQSDKFERVDSFGTAGYHKGESPDYRSSKTCLAHGILIDHRAQQIRPHHFDEFDFIICMDEANLANLNDIKPKKSRAKLTMFGEYNSGQKFNEIVDDPYYGGDDGFEYNFRQVWYFSEEFLKRELNL